MQRNFYLLSFITLALWSCPKLVLAQIIPAAQDAGSQVQVAPTNPNQWEITGGTQTGQNLFHGFQQFDLGTGQIANFRTNPTIQNILSRVVGGNPSTINGLIQVTGGNSNLFLLNPAGIIFGANARLNIPAAFTATTANGIGVGNAWLSAVGSNDYRQLGGNPSQLAFTTLQPGAIVNAGNLSVGLGQSLTLVGGTVINTGTITAPGGTVTIAAVPGENLVRISEPGGLLSLTLPLATQDTLNPATGSPVSLPELLTGGGLSQATGVAVKDGVVTLTSSGLKIPTQSGVAVIANQVDVSGSTGGRVDLLGQTVGVVDATINASGLNGGGQVRIGGDYQGQGTLPRAQNTLVTQGTTINASAIAQGNAGSAIVWADQTTQFSGTIAARGGAQSGNGGLVEVSGKANLNFNGVVDTLAPAGMVGTLLLDPGTVTIQTPGALTDRFIFDPVNQLNAIAEGNSGSFNFSVSPGQIVSLLNTSDVSIAAQDAINVNEAINASGNIRVSKFTLSAPRIDVNDRITLNGGTLSLNAVTSSSRTADRLNIYELNSNGGNIVLAGPRISFGTVNSQGGNININGPVVLSGFAPIVNSKTGAANNATGNIQFSSTINSGGVRDDLTINAKGNVTVLDNIGNTSPLGTFAIRDGFTVGANAVALRGFQGNTLNVSAIGDVTIDAPNALAAAMFIRSSGADGIRITALGNINLPNSFLDTSNSIGSTTGSVAVNANGGTLTLDSTFVDAVRDIRLQGQAVTVQGDSLNAKRDLTVQTTTSNITLQNVGLSAENTLSLSTPQTLTLQGVTHSGSFDPAQVNLQGGSIALTNSQLLARQDLTATATTTSLTVDNGQLQAYQDLTLQAPNTLSLTNGGSLLAGRNLNLAATGATGQVKIADAVGGNPMIVRSGNALKIQAPQAVTITALNRPESVFRSGGNLTLASNGVVTGDGRFISGQNFAVTTIAGTSGDFRYTPQNSTGIVSAAGDVTFSTYTGKSLKIEAGGSIQGGAIDITSANTPLQGTDADIALLSSEPAVILRAGLTELRQTLNVLPTETELRNAPNLLPGFSTNAAASNPARIVVGDIKVATTTLAGSDAVILAAPGSITTGSISTDGGNVRLTAKTGNITVNTINTRRFAKGGGSVTIATDGLFRATDTFAFTYQDPFPNFTTSATSILTGTSSFGANASLDGKALPGTISLQSGGKTFVENYAPGPLAVDASGTAGLILRADGSNASLVPSFRDRVLIGNTGNFNPGGGGNGGGGNGGNGDGGGGDNNDGVTRGGSDPTAAVERQRNQTSAACGPAPILAAAPAGATRSEAAPDRLATTTPTATGCQPLEEDATILKILEEPKSTSQNPADRLNQTLVQHAKLAQQRLAQASPFILSPPETFAPQSRR